MVPIGVGVGDVIEIAKLTRSVIAELKKTSEALPEYRALLQELDLLAQLLDQIDQQTSKLKRAEGHNIDQVELIQACCAACQNPLQKFLNKISKFEPSLGVWSKNGKTLTGVGRRIQWKVSYENDVRELRTILMGHNVKILLCQNILIGESLCAAKTDRTENIQSLIKAHHTLLENLNSSQVTIFEDTRRQQRTTLDQIAQCERQIVSMADANETVYKDLGMKIDESLKFDAESQTKLDSQVGTLRSIQMEITSLRDCHLSPYKSTANFPADTFKQQPTLLKNSLAILMAVLAGSNAALAYKLGTQKDSVHQLPVLHFTNAHKVTARSQDCSEPKKSVRPALKSLHQVRATRLSVEQSYRAKHSLSPSKEDESWEALWHSSNHSNGGLDSLRNGIKYADLSFYLRIDPLAPNYEAQPIQHGAQNYWFPPNIRTGYNRGHGRLFHWKGGVITPVVADDAVRHSLDRTYSAATVFTQNPDTPHLLAVPFDAQLIHAHQNQGGWRPLAFKHVLMNGTSGFTYSAVSVFGDRQHIAARGSPNWMPQLLPTVYNCQTGSPGIQAGLIGSIPLLIALAAFSAPPAALANVLTKSLRPRCWRPHQYTYPAGQIAERGMVVSVFYDPTNPQGSTPALLDMIENGQFGPFYS